MYRIPKGLPKNYVKALAEPHGDGDHKGLRRQLDIAFANSDRETVKQLTPVVLGTKDHFWAPLQK